CASRGLEPWTGARTVALALPQTGRGRRLSAGAAWPVAPGRVPRRDAASPAVRVPRPDRRNHPVAETTGGMGDKTGLPHRRHAQTRAHAAAVAAALPRR